MLSSEPGVSARDDSSRPFNSKRKRACLSVIAVSESQVDTKISENAHLESRSLENYPLFNSETSIVELLNHRRALLAPALIRNMIIKRSLVRMLI